MRVWQIVAFAPFVALLVGGCTPIETVTNQEPLSAGDQEFDPLALRPFADCDAMYAHLQDAYVESLARSDFRYGANVDSYSAEWFGVEEDAISDDGGGGESAASRDPASVSQTNLQEVGVDESDIVKVAANGDMFLLDDNALRWIDAFPAETMQIRQTLYLPEQTYADSLYLDDSGDVWVLGWSYDEDTYGYSVLLQAQLVDGAYEWAHAVRTSGSTISSRRVGSTLYWVVSDYMYLYDYIGDRNYERAYFKVDELLLEAGYEEDWPQWDELSDELQEAIREIWQPVVAKAIEKLRANGDVHGQITVDGEVVASSCSNVFASESLDEPEILRVLSITDDLTIEDTAILGTGWITYATPTAIWVAQSSLWWWGPWWWGFDTRQTVMHRFAIKDTVQYSGYGKVDGWIYDSWAMRERDGFLTVVSSGNDNSLFALDLSGVVDANSTTVPTVFEVAGAVTELARGESVQSVRYVGNTAYVVTLPDRKVDPLFAIDLADPAKPEVLSELKIPGFSTYMHPIDDGRLLTIGFDGDEDGTISGLALKTFDVSDPANLAQEFVLQLGADWGGYSNALWDYHAFTWFAESRHLAIPFVDYGNSISEAFSGTVVVHVDSEGAITEVARIDHSDQAVSVFCPNGVYDEYPDDYDDWDDKACYDYDLFWYTSPRRATFASSGDDVLVYSIASPGIKAVDLAAPTVVTGALELPKQESDYYGWYWYEAKPVRPPLRGIRLGE